MTTNFKKPAVVNFIVETGVPLAVLTAVCYTLGVSLGSSSVIFIAVALAVVFPFVNAFVIKPFFSAICLPDGSKETVALRAASNAAITAVLTLAFLDK